MMCGPKEGLPKTIPTIPYDEFPPPSMFTSGGQWASPEIMNAQNAGQMQIWGPSQDNKSWKDRIGMAADKFKNSGALENQEMAPQNQFQFSPLGDPAGMNNSSGPFTQAILAQILSGYGGK